MLSHGQRSFATTLSELSFCNPFEPRRIDLERAALGEAWVAEDLAAWSRTRGVARHERPNVAAITARATELMERWRSDAAEVGLPDADLTIYDDLVTYVLYYRSIAKLVLVGGGAPADDLTAAWRSFRDERARLLHPLSPEQRTRLSADAHLFACLYQVRRAFTHIFECLIGESAPATRLRGQVWQSIFTHDLRRYRRTLYRSLRDLATLVTGPSGSGKELVARAIGLSQYRAFDERTGRFEGEDDPAAPGGFVPINLSALSPTVIESELFGHRRGAFTGATDHHAGWLERCPAHGAVFLDEIGELDGAIQVKLLRVVQSRDYSRLGETRPRSFAAKIVAATNRDLAVEMREGRFREDLYYRLCSDRIVAPALRDHLQDRPGALRGLIEFLAQRIVGDEPGEAEQLTDEVQRFVGASLPADYAWPGNIRELEQCVRNVLVRREYQPATAHSHEAARPDWLQAAAAGELTADELLNHYCRLVHRQRGGYEQAARALGLDRRTVKARAAKAATPEA